MSKTKELAEKLKQKIAAATFDKIGKLTCRIGLTAIKEGDTSPVLFDRVDQAMYEAKSSGRNCVRLA